MRVFWCSVAIAIVAAAGCEVDVVTLEGRPCAADGACPDDLKCVFDKCVSSEGCACTPPLPEGWQGPFPFTESSDAMSEEPCPQGTETLPPLFAGEPEPMRCRDCVYQVENASCSPAKARCHTAITCGQAPLVTPELVPPCQQWQQTDGPMYCRQEQLTGQYNGDGTCEPRTGQVSGGVDGDKGWWQKRYARCQLPGDGCGEGRACAPFAPNGERSDMCISSAGDSGQCPDVDRWRDGRSYVVYASQTDDRDCPACPVNPALEHDPTCGDGELYVYADEDCLTSETLVGPTCTYYLSMKFWRAVPAAPVGGTCPTVALTPTGGFAAAEPHTLCCISP